MATNFLDLMAFADGANLAVERQRAQDNQLWLDQLNAQRLEQGDANLAQSAFNLNKDQFNFGIQAPVATIQGQNALSLAEQQGQSIQAGRDFASFITDVNKGATAIAPEGQAGYQAARLAERLQASNNPAEVQLIQQQGLLFAQQAARRGYLQGAQSILSQLPGQDQGGILAAQQWNDPAYYTNDANITAAGGQVQPDGTVRIQGVNAPLTKEQFATFQRSRQQNAGFNAPAFLQPLTQRQQGVDQNAAFAQQLAPGYEALGQRVFVNPATGLPTLVPIPAVDATAAYPEPNSVRFGQGAQPVFTAPAAQSVPVLPAATVPSVVSAPQVVPQAAPAVAGNWAPVVQPQQTTPQALADLRLLYAPQQQPVYNPAAAVVPNRAAGWLTQPGAR